MTPLVEEKMGVVKYVVTFENTKDQQILMLVGLLNQSHSKR